MAGSTQWAETVAASGNDLNKASDTESVSVQQSLAFGADDKAAYRLAEHPVGHDASSALHRIIRFKGTPRLLMAFIRRIAG